MTEGEIEKVEGELATRILKNAAERWQIRAQSRHPDIEGISKILIGAAAEIALRLAPHVMHDLRLSADDALELRASILAMAGRHLTDEKKIAEMLKIKWPPDEKINQNVLIDKYAV